MSWVPPRRIVSEPTSVTVQSEGTGDAWGTVMGLAITDSSGWSINGGTVNARGFKHFECDPANRNSPDYRHLSDYYPHTVRSGVPRTYGLCDYSTDGYKTGGCDPTPAGTIPTGEVFHTCINWSSKANYDPIKKRVMWMTKGTGSEDAQWVYNTLAIYRLGHNETEGWTSVRGFRATTEPDASDPYALPMTHYFGNNCIDWRGRRMYKKAFQTTNGLPYGDPLRDRGRSGPFFVFDLDSDVSTAVVGANNSHLFKPSLLAPADDPYAAGMGPLDFIPSRGSQGTLWYSNASGNPRIYEYDPATGTGARADWIVIAPSGLMPDIPNNFRAYDSMGVMIHNPRALGGAGAVIICGGSGYGGKPPTTYMWSLGTPGSKIPYGSPGGPQVYRIDGAHLPFTLGGGIQGGEGHIVPHPTLDGWLLFPMNATLSPEDDVVWYLGGDPGSTWQKLLDPNGNTYPMPNSAAPMGPVVCIEELGACWIVGQRPGSNVATTPRAWLFKP